MAQARQVLIGREPELSAMSDVLRRARSGQAQVVVLEGEPGIGKSVLLDSFVEQHDLGRSESVRWLRCDEFEQNLRFGAVGRLLGEVSTDASEVEVGRRLLGWFSDQQADVRVAVLVVDDAQWMDRASAKALQFAIRRLGADRVLCLVGRRLVPTGDADLRTDDPRATTVLRLDRLDAAAVGDFARRRRGWDLTPATAEYLVARTGGLPLLVAAVVRGADDEQHLATTPLPGSVAAAVTRMLDTLDPSARQLLEAAAILGEPSPLTVVGQVADVPDPAAALTSATLSGLLAETNDGTVEVSHDMTAHAVRQGLTPARRRELHRRAAGWATGDRRLAHRAAASDRPDPQLAADLVAAADAARAARRYGVAATNRLHARTVASDPGHQERLLVDALVDRVEAEDLDGADELAALVRQSAPSARRSLALGLLARERGEVGRARTLLREAVDEAETSGDTVTATSAALAGSMLAVWIGDATDAMDLLTHTRPPDDSARAEIGTDVATTMGIGLWLLGDLDDALAALDAVERSPAGTSSEAELLAVRGMIGFYEGRPRAALADLDAAVQMMHLWRPWTNQSRIFMLRSLTRFALGDWDGAAVDAAAARALAEGPTQLWSLALALSISVDVPAHRGQWAVAEEYLARATESAPALTQITEIVARHAVELARARGDHGGVLAVLDPLWTESFVERMSRTRQIQPMAVARTAALVAVGRLDEAADELRSYERNTDRWPGGEEPAQLGLLRGLLAEARNEPRAAQDHYATDLADPAYHQFPLRWAQLLVTSGRLERTLGHRREAVRRLTQARDVLVRLRARPLLERCNRELSACGLPSRLDDPLALTPREEDVVALVRRGYTNKEMATELFLTARTVEYHLRNIYAKLGVHGRQELRRVLDLTDP